MFDNKRLLMTGPWGDILPGRSYDLPVHPCSLQHLIYPRRNEKQATFGGHGETNAISGITWVNALYNIP
jgi:hypothetical protein